MNIIPCFNLNNKNTNFKMKKANIRLSNYQDLKLIPNLNCACCGRKTINPIDFHLAFRTITLPLKSIMQRGLFKTWEKSTPTWNFLVSLCQKFPDKSLDQMEANKDSYHGRLFETIKESLKVDPRGSENDTPKELQERIKGLYHDLLNRSRARLRGSKQVMSKMKCFKKNLEKDPVKLAVFEQLEIYSEKYPRKTLSEILGMDEIFKFHSTKDLLQRAETREKLDYHFGNIEKIIKKEAPNALETFVELKEKSLEIIDRERDPESRIPKMKKLYAKELEKIGCQNLIKKINKELDQVPITFITKDSFLAFAHRHDMTDYQILSSLLTPSVANTEHIDAVSNGGNNHLGNISVLCKDCNQKRGKTPYSEFVEYHPEMPQNEQRQINQISRFILNNDVDENAIYYPIEVSKTLDRLSDGKIQPDVSAYCEKVDAKINQHITEQQEQIQRLREEREEMFNEKEALLKRLDEINQTRNEKKKEIKNIGENINKERSRSNLMQRYINDKKTT